MSHSGNPISDVRFHDLSDRFRDSVTCEVNKPDFRELDLGSPVSPLRTRHQIGGGPAVSSSSSSSGSVSGRNGQNPVAKRSDSGPNNHSGELSGSSESSPTAAESLRSIGTPRNFKSGHNRSDSASNHPLIYSGQSQSSVTSPSNVLPTGNICPSGRILKPSMPTTNRSSRTDVLGSGSGNYGHGSIMRGLGGAKPVAVESVSNVSSRGGGVGGGDSLKRAKQSGDPEELKRAGNEQYKKGHFAEALSLYDRAIAISPANPAYRSNRAAALTSLQRLGEAVSECEEAVRLDPNYTRAHQRLASLYRRWVSVA